MWNGKGEEACIGDQLKDLVSQNEDALEFYCLFTWDEMTWRRTDRSLILQVIEVLQAIQDKFPAHSVIWSNITPRYGLEG